MGPNFVSPESLKNIPCDVKKNKQKLDKETTGVTYSKLQKRERGTIRAS